MKLKKNLQPTSTEALVLDPFQQKYLAGPPSGKTLVVAGPGSGKTTIALKKTIQIDKEFRSEATRAVLFLSFSRASISAASRSMREELDALKVEFQAQTIDSLAFEICKYDDPNFDENRLARSSFESRLCRATAIAKEDFGDLTADLCHVFIDEAQDISPAQATFLRHYLSHLPSDCGVTVFADPDQEIYRFLDSLDEALEVSRWENLEHEFDFSHGWNLLRFKSSHRPKTASAAALFKALDEVRDMEARSEKVRTLDELQARLPTITLERLAALSNMNNDRNAVLVRNNSDVADVFQGLITAGCTSVSPVLIPEWRGKIPAWVSRAFADFSDQHFHSAELLSYLRPRLTNVELEKTKEVLDLDFQRQMTWNDVRSCFLRAPELLAYSEDSNLAVSTIHQAKGLEFANVGILEPERLLERQPAESELLFVALSRARSNVFRISDPPRANRQNSRRRSFEYKFARSSKKLIGLTILPTDLDVPETLASKSVDALRHATIGDLVAFDPIRTRDYPVYVCSLNGVPFAETSEAFGKVLKRHLGSQSQFPRLGSVPIARLETDFIGLEQTLQAFAIAKPLGFATVN